MLPVFNLLWLLNVLRLRGQLWAHVVLQDRAYNANMVLLPIRDAGTLRSAGTNVPPVSNLIAVLRREGAERLGATPAFCPNGKGLVQLQALLANSRCEPNRRPTYVRAPTCACSLAPRRVPLELCGRGPHDKGCEERLHDHRGRLATTVAVDEATNFLPTLKMILWDAHHHRKTGHPEGATW